MLPEITDNMMMKTELVFRINYIRWLNRSFVGKMANLSSPPDAFPYAEIADDPGNEQRQCQLPANLSGFSEVAGDLKHVPSTTRITD